MIPDIYRKLFDGEEYTYDKDNEPIPIIRIEKQGNRYVAFNIKKPFLREYFNSAEEFLKAIGSPAARPKAFDDQTGEDIFRGR